MPLSKPLEQFKEDLRETAVTLGLPDAIRLLNTHLADGKQTKDNLHLISGRLQEANLNHNTRGVLDTDDYLREINRIRVGFFDLVNTLQAADFEADAPDVPAKPKLLSGSVPKFVLLYDQRDEAGAKALNKQLITLKRAGKLILYNAWSSLKSGEPIDEARNEAADAAYLLLLISSNLIDDDLGETPWLDLAMELKQAGKRLIPIYLNKFTLEFSGLESLKALPAGGKTVADFANADAAFAEIANELRRLVA